MSITLYSKYRRMGLRNAWPLAGMAEWSRNVGAGISALLGALLLTQWIDDELSRADAAERVAAVRKQETEILEAILVSCLNGRGIWIGDKLNLCHIADTHLTKTHFLTE